MKKTLIKVIKRKDVEATIESQSASQLPKAFLEGAEKAENRLRQAMDTTVSTWVSESRRKNRADPSAAINKFFGNEILLGPI